MTELEKHALSIRRKIVDMVHNASSGHPGGSLSATDIVTYLYFKEMDINKDNLNSCDRDRFVLSKGHASPVLYATLHEKGLIDEDLHTFRQINSHLQGHPSYGKLAGVDMSTGSLGQGISVAVGMALANKLDNKDHRVYVLCGDGESQEGIVYEAIMAACHYKLDNLCVFFDANHLQIDGKVEEVLNTYPLKEKFEGFGCNVLEINGHDFKEIEEALNKARETKEKPTVIIANTIKGKGVSFMENNAGFHGVAPNDDEYKIAMEELKEA